MAIPEVLHICDIRRTQDGFSTGPIRVLWGGHQLIIGSQEDKTSTVTLVGCSYLTHFRATDSKTDVVLHSTHTVRLHGITALNHIICMLLSLTPFCRALWGAFYSTLCRDFCRAICRALWGAFYRALCRDFCRALWGDFLSYRSWFDQLYCHQYALTHTLGIITHTVRWVQSVTHGLGTMTRKHFRCNSVTAVYMVHGLTLCRWWFFD